MSRDRSRSPAVSVIMPAFNVERYVGGAIESILRQSFSDFEFIIIDDCSRDGTPDVIRNFARKDARILFRSLSRNLQRARASNTGLALAKGRYVATMDADDVALPHRLQEQVRFLDAHPDVGMVGGAMILVNERAIPFGTRRYPTEDAAIRRRIFRYNPFCHTGVMMRRSVLDRTGFYDPRYRTAQDYDLFFRIGQISKFANLPDFIQCYRLRPGSTMFKDLRGTECRTITIRKKYFQSYGAGWTDRLYTVLQRCSMFLLPSTWKAWLFLKVREVMI